MDIMSFSKCWSVSQSCCRDEVIKQRVSNHELSMSLPDRKEEETNQEKSSSAVLILIPGQRQETGSCRGYRLKGLIYGKIYLFLSETTV